MLFLNHIIKFLSPTRRVPAKVLVVEGWLSHKCLDKAIIEFERGEYHLLITTDPQRTGFTTDEHDKATSFTKNAKQYFVQRGIESSKIVAVPAPPVKTHWTYFSAASVAEWLETHHPSVRFVNVLTWSIHGRKTWVLYRRALKGKHVGIISVYGGKRQINRITRSRVKWITKHAVGWVYAVIWKFPE